MLGGLITKVAKDLFPPIKNSSKEGILTSMIFLTLFNLWRLLAPYWRNPLKITGISHTRLQETDRVNAMATELEKLGQKVIEKDDSLEIIPDLNKFRESARNGIAIETYEDHREVYVFCCIRQF